jgi:hypothetical protein
MTDAEILDLVLEEGRAHLATLRNAAKYDNAEIGVAEAISNGHHLLREWNKARERLRAAVLDRLEAETAVRN